MTSNHISRASKANTIDPSSIVVKDYGAISSRQQLLDYDTSSEPWTKSLAKSFRNHLQLSHVMNNVEDVDSRVYKAFDCRVTPYLAQLMDEDDPNCPIRLQYIPSSLELNVLPYEIEDRLGEDADMIPGTALVHRYPNRVLFLVHNTCGSLCRYCTRKRFVTNNDRSVVKDEIETAIDYLSTAYEVNDCLLSGGDPLMLTDERLDYIIGQIRLRAPHVKFIRIGTRLPTQLPTRITKEFCELVERHDVQMINIHINHVKEITPLLIERLRMLRKTGVMLGNQTVLLRGVNDTVGALRDLCMKLVEIGVRPYYVYSCDPAEGNDRFIVGLREAKGLYAGLRGWISGPAIPTFVVDGVGGLGKLPILPTYVEEDSLGVTATNYKGDTVRMDFLTSKTFLRSAQ